MPVPGAKMPRQDWLLRFALQKEFVTQQQGVELFRCQAPALAERFSTLWSTL